MKRQPDLWTMILTRINGVRSIKSHLIKIMSIAKKHSCSKLRDPMIVTSSYLITRRAPALPWQTDSWHLCKAVHSDTGAVTSRCQMSLCLVVDLLSGWYIYHYMNTRSHHSGLDRAVWILPSQTRSHWKKRIDIDQVWSILPAFGLLSHDCSGRRGSNSDAGKMDQTWSRIDSLFRSILFAEFLQICWQVGLKNNLYWGSFFDSEHE